MITPRLRDSICRTILGVFDRNHLKGIRPDCLYTHALVTQNGVIVFTAEELQTWTNGYSELVGNGSDTTIDVEHSLNSLAPIVQVWEAGGLMREVAVEKRIVDANTVRLVFGSAPTTDQYRVSVLRARVL